MSRARLLVSVLIFSAAFQGATPPSGAAELTTAGWWWRAQAGAVRLPSPPHVPANGLAVGNAPDGPTAVAAVRFALQSEEVDPILTLQTAEQLGGDVALVACASGAPWFGAQAGNWGERPEASCERGTVKGVASPDGKGWTFPLGALYADGLLDVVILPEEGSDPFEISFEPPAGASLQTRPAPSASGFESNLDSTGDDGAGFDPSGGDFYGGTEFGRPLTPPLPRSAGTGGEAADGPAASGTRQEFVRIAQSPRPATDAGADPRLLALVILLATLAVAVMMRREPLPAPRLLGPMAGRREPDVEESEVRGLGRFRRERRGTPPSLH